MKKPSGVLLWVLIGTGLLLVYAAYKGKSPKEILTNVAGQVKR